MVPGPLVRALVSPLIALVLVASAPASAKQFDADSFTLANGLQVVVVPFHRAPVVTQMIWYKAGAYDDPPGKSGIAHFVEHLMFRGTKETPPGAFSRLISETGGRENASTSPDYTVYYQTVAADRLELVMKLEAERMHDLEITEDQVTPEREVIIEERRARIDNVPAALLDEQRNAVLFLNNHYRLPAIGWLTEMRGLGAEDARRFYATWYAPNNAVLVIAGDVEMARVRALAETYYGPIPARPVPQHAALVEPPKVATMRLEMTSGHVASPEWSRSYVAPGYVEAGGKPADALTVLAAILGGGDSARLYQSLVIDKKLVVSTGAGYDPYRGAGSFSVYAEPKDGVEIADVEAAVVAEIRRLLSEGVTAAEVERVKPRLQASAIYSRDSLSSVARIIGASMVAGRTLDEIQAWPERIGAVTPEDVMDVARQVLKDDAAVTAVLLPEKRS
ncbi:MAG TPA: pitrilysin family protein [Stellaceae bacterium]|nr:pitrilysin family protein [Stellaceae bacterium]